MEMSELLEQAMKLGASDVHLSPHRVPMVRINGVLGDIPNTTAIEPEELRRIMYTLLSADEQALLEKKLDYDFSFFLPYLGGFRGNIYNTIHGLAGAFRLIPSEIPTLDLLDTPPIFKELLNLENGLILVTGPTGSGKTTTLAAMVNYINKNHSKHIIAVEDPVEFIHQSEKSLIHQRQIRRDTKSFSTALRAALREDPDVILIGELRDLETIRIALRAAETGHLVLATLHTRSAPQTISRIIDMFDVNEKTTMRNMLSESLRAVITQTLVKRISGGRIAAFEIMLGTPAIRNLIRADQIAQMSSIIQTNASAGMSTLDQYLDELVHKGLVSQETAHDITKNRQISD